ncbi:hypothetical protein ACFLZJ_00110 [Nanoarchaeota archaeon]
MLNKKAQVGETMTWIIATIAIIVILLLSLYASSVLGKLKVVNSKDVNEEIDRLGKKTALTYFLDSSNKQIIQNWIKEVENENG